MRLLSILAMYFLASSYVYSASSSSFTVSGSVKGSTCKLVVGANSTVFLATQRTSALVNAGDTAGKKKFQISVSGCSTQVSIYFYNDQSTITSLGRLANTVLPVDGGAENVELQVLNENGQPVKLAAEKGKQDGSVAVSGSALDTAIFSFFVQYYASGQAKAGKVKSSLTFLAEQF